MLSRLLINYSNGINAPVYEQILGLLTPTPIVKDQTLLESHLLRKFKKLRFFEFIGSNRKLLEALPIHIRNEVDKPFLKAESSNLILYRPSP